MIKLAITGGSGVLGYYLQQFFSTKSNYKILSLGRTPSKFNLPNIEFILTDLEKKNDVKKNILNFGPDFIIHAAASGMKISERSNWAMMTGFNINSTLNLIESAKEVSAKLIYLGSGLCYQDQKRPLKEDDALSSSHAYADSKITVENLVKSAASHLEIPSIILRPFSFTGATDHSERLFPMLLEAAVNQEEYKVKNGDQIRDYLVAEDIVLAIEKLILNGFKGIKNNFCEVYNLGMGDFKPLKGLIESVCKDLKLNIKLDFAKTNESVFLAPDCSKIEQSIGWRPSIRLSYAVWELARLKYPDLILQKPSKSL